MQEKRSELAEADDLVQRIGNEVIAGKNNLIQGGVINETGTSREN